MNSFSAQALYTENSDPAVTMMSLYDGPLLPEYRQFTFTTEELPVIYMPPLFAPAQLPTMLQSYINIVEYDSTYNPPP
jgi:hypothetical protein